jgi:PAS domain S-box-containing protein
LTQSIIPDPSLAEPEHLRRRQAELEAELARVRLILQARQCSSDQREERAEAAGLPDATTETRPASRSASDDAAACQPPDRRGEAELAAAATRSEAPPPADNAGRGMEAAPWESPALHRLIVESATDYAILTLDLAGRITSWNKGAQRILGWQEADILGRPVGIIFVPEDQDAPQAEMTAALEHGHAADERWHIRQDGTRFWARGAMMPLRDGETRGFLKILRDHTEFRRARDEALAAETWAETILETMDEAFIAMDRHFRVTRVNGKTLTLDGRRREEILGRSYWEVWPSAVGTPLEAAYRRCLSEQVPAFIQHRYVSDRHDIWFDLRAYPSPDGIAVFLRDIGNAKRDEQALRMRARRLEIMSEAAANLLEARDPDEVMQPLLQALSDELEIDSCFSYLLDQADGTLHLASCFGVPDQAKAEFARIQSGNNYLSSFVAQTLQPVHATDIQNSDDPKLEVLRQHGVHAVACFPLLAAGRLLGTTAFVTLRRDRFSEADFAFLGAITHQMSVVRERFRAETELRQQTGLLATITDHAAEALFLMDQEGRVTFANPAAERIFGWRQDELLGSLLPDLLHHHYPDGRPYPARECPLMDSLLSGQVLSGHEDVYLCKDGRRIDVLCSNAPILLDGRVAGSVLVVHDITARKSSERALAESEARLRESEARFRKLADLSPAMTWFGQVDGTLSYLNNAWYEYTGLTPEESLPDGWARILHPEDTDRLLLDWDTARHNGSSYETECRFLRHDGTYRWFQIQAMPLRDAAGEITGWLGNSHDIHDSKIAQQALRELNGELETRVAERTAERDRMWRLSSDIMLVARFDATIIAVNPAWGTVLGWTEEELLEKRFLELVHPDDREPTAAVMERLSQGIRVLHFENRYRHKDGGYRWLSWTTVPDENFIHAVGRDVTAGKAAAEELEQAQEQLRQAQKMEAVGQLTGGLAHDFNNLLTSIVGSLSMMRARIAQGRADALDRYLDVAQSSANRAAALTHRLLAFSRRQKLDPKPTDVAMLVASLEDLIQRTVGPGIVVETAMAADLWTTLCDPNQLENALLNLAINGRDAMPEGGCLTIKTKNMPLGDARAARQRGLNPGDYVMVSVTDTGIGMAPEILDRVFEPFFTTKPQGRGTGLGLSMVYGFAQQSGGHARITSKLGQGTTVRIYLPRYLGALPDQAGSPEPDGMQEVQSGKTVLVVDDEEGIRMLATEALEELGYEAMEAGNGAEALRILQSGKPLDLLVTDVGMPGGMNGRQLAEAARAQRPDLKILFITGYAENAVFGNAPLDPGMQIIIKPFTMDILAARIRTMISERPSR